MNRESSCTDILEQKLTDGSARRTAPLPGQWRHGFRNAQLVPGEYSIAIWNYTKGAYLATLVGFKPQFTDALFIGPGAVCMILAHVSHVYDGMNKKHFMSNKRIRHPA
ncbi:MAG: hypothetical protein IJ828_02780 [Treponema sp.]|nr:hypothetical protein [Treponema sp.]